MKATKSVPDTVTKLPENAFSTTVEIFLNSHYEFRCSNSYKGLLGTIRAFFNRRDIEERERCETGERYYEPSIFYSGPVSKEKQEQDRLRSILEQSFAIALMNAIEASGKDHVEVYKRANIDRKLFSKIRTQHEYVPSKKTIIALALALELSLDEAQALLKRAGFTLSRSILFDVIIEYFFLQEKYDIFEINSVLIAYKQPMLG